MRGNSVWRETMASSVCHKILSGRCDARVACHCSMPNAVSSHLLSSVWIWRDFYFFYDLKILFSCSAVLGKWLLLVSPVDLWWFAAMESTSSTPPWHCATRVSDRPRSSSGPRTRRDTPSARAACPLNCSKISRRRARLSQILEPMVGIGANDFCCANFLYGTF